MDLSEHTLRLLEVAGTWAGAIGTVGAVIVSLMLARNSEAKLHPSTEIYEIAQKDKASRCLRIFVYNTGGSSAHIRKIGYSLGFFKRKHYEIVDYEKLFRDEGSREIMPGDDHKVLLIDNRKRRLDIFIEVVANIKSSRGLPFWIRTYVTTSTGHTTYGRLEKPAFDWLAAEIWVRKEAMAKAARTAMR